MRRRVLVAGCALVALLAAVIAWLVVVAQRPEQGGPLGGGDDAGIVVDAFSADSEVTYGLQNLTNSGPDSIVIEDVEVLLGDPGLELLDDVMAYGPSRLEGWDFNLFDVRGGWPPPDDDATALIGASIAPFDDVGLEVLIGVRVPSVDEGAGVLEGVRVSYSSAGSQFVKTFHLAMTICPRERTDVCDDVVASPPDG